MAFPWEASVSAPWRRPSKLGSYNAYLKSLAGGNDITHQGL